MSERPVIVWFRHDLRLSDNSAIQAAKKHGGPVIFTFVYDPEKTRHYGAASRWWLHHSLTALQKSLNDLGAKLLVQRGKTQEVLLALAQENKADTIVCSRQYEPHEIALEKTLYSLCTDNGIVFKRYTGYLQFEPETIATQSGSPYKVFTPFWRRCNACWQSSTPIKAPKTLHQPKTLATKGLAIAELGLLPKKPNWAAPFDENWTPGEQGALQALKAFGKRALAEYDEGRDKPAEHGTSRLSPHLHFGEISTRQIFNHIENLKTHINQKDKARFSSEIGWREFCHHLLFHFPHLPDKAFNPKFNHFPWRRNAKALKRWQQGNTGIPLVDAGMRELWQTGWMHNRVRMVVASFLVKNLNIPWQEGERWFWDTLVDANLANNAAGWQWVAGSGADAAPYFRIFNPVSQGQRFDPEGLYIKRWVPELGKIPKKYIHAPWTAPSQVLSEAAVTLGKDYPSPMVDLKTSREDALAAYKSLP